MRHAHPIGRDVARDAWERALDAVVTNLAGLACLGLAVLVALRATSPGAAAFAVIFAVCGALLLARADRP